jgi:asparagine synthase (glutamine-hydrolysing)
MCGICGVYSIDESHVDKNLLRQMCTVIKHRGPDDEGIFLDDYIGLGMCRLSIIDLETGHQPIHNEDESIWIVFNGEIYNYRELRQFLEQKKHRFYTLSDTEVIIHLYEELGDDCVTMLNGMFAFAIWDSNKKKLLLARDRIGIKPLHYIILNDKLIFGSEIKSILQDADVKREVNLEALHHFLAFEYVPAPETMFRGIKKLLPGHILICEKGNVSLKKYWDLKFQNHNKQPVSYYSDRIYDLLKKSVERRLISDVPLGAFLSGGIDSSSVVGLMTELTDDQVKTFSIGFEEQSYNELKYAKIVAEHFETEHYEEIITPDAVNLVNKIIQYLDEPFADVSVFPTYLVSELARKHVTVVLSGDGGDEQLAGYDWYVASKLDRYYRKAPAVLRNGVTKIIQKLPPTPQKKGLVNMLKRFAEGSSLPIDGRHIRWQYFITDKEREHLYTNNLNGELHNLSSFDLINKYYLRDNANDKLSKEQYVDIKVYLPDDILVKVDRMSMANSLEARVPFLDHEFVEFLATIPSNLKLHGLTTKYILKKTMSRLLPREIIYRKKQGFSIPMKNWLRDDLRNLMLDVLSEKRIKENGFFNYDYVNKIMQQHLEGKRNNAHQLWALMTFELWHEMFIGQEVKQ